MSADFDRVITLLFSEFPVPHGDLEKLNWEQIARSSLDLRLAPMLYGALARRKLLAHLPPAPGLQLRTAYLSNLGHSIDCISLASQLVKLLCQSGVEVILLKGIAYVQEIYDDVGERVLGDLDLLVPPSKLAVARSVLLEAGLGEETCRDYSRHHHLAPFVAPGGRRVEIHHHLAPVANPVRIETDPLWNDSVPSAFLPPARLLNPLDCVIHSSIHLIINSAVSGQIYQLIDIRRLLSVHFGDPDRYNQLLDRAAGTGTRSYVEEALRLCESKLFLKIPLRLLERPVPVTWRIWRHLAGTTIAGQHLGSVPPLKFRLYGEVLALLHFFWNTSSLRSRIKYAITKSVALLCHLLLERLRASRRGPRKTVSS
ncbi:MAG: nucleotidyltransferase family protein [Acidobacteriota bacterium]